MTWLTEIKFLYSYSPVLRSSRTVDSWFGYVIEIMDL